MWFFQADEKGLDLLDKLLSFDPIRRVDVEGSLAHAYLSPYYDPADEPLAEKPFTYDMEFDELPIKELREMVYKEAVDFKMAKLTETPLWSCLSNTELGVLKDPKIQPLLNARQTPV